MKTMKSRRIGIDARMYSNNFTGIGRYTYELIAEVIQRDKHNTYVIFLNEPEFSSFSLKAPNIETVCVNAKHYSLREQLIFPIKLYKAKLDLTHFTHFNSPLLYFGKQIVTIHDLTLSYFQGKKMTSLLHRLAYHLSVWSVTKKAKKIIAVSKNTKTDIEKLLHIPSKKIQVVYEGASSSFVKVNDEALLQKVRNTYNLTKPYFLYAGVWRSHKNVLGLVKAFHILRNEYNLDMDLVITGRKDPVYHEVPDLVESLGLTNNVHFVGLVPQEDLNLLFNAANTYVFPSFYEGFGLPALEAFSVDLPVASSNTSCLPEICGDGNAIFFDPYSPEDMAEKLYEVATNDDLRKKLVIGGRKRLKDFSWSKMGEETLDVYHSLI